MNDNREYFLSQLAEKKREFEQALKRLVDKQREYQEHLEGESSMDESDQALREISASSNYGLIERKSRELKRIDRLIRQVLADTHFGICEECGNAIPPARILIVPEATLCVGCQRELEKMDNMKRIPGSNALRLKMQPREDDETESALPIIDDEVIDSDLEITPLLDLDEPLGAVFSKDAQ